MLSRFGTIFFSRRGLLGVLGVVEGRKRWKFEAAINNNGLELKEREAEKGKKNEQENWGRLAWCTVHLCYLSSVMLDVKEIIFF